MIMVMLKTPTKRIKGHPLQPCPLGNGFPLFQNHSISEWDQFPHVLDFCLGSSPHFFLHLIRHSGALLLIGILPSSAPVANLTKLDGRSSMGLEYLPRFDVDGTGICIGNYAIQGAYELIFCKRSVVLAKHLKTRLVILDHLPKFRVKRITHVCSTTR